MKFSRERQRLYLVLLLTMVLGIVLSSLGAGYWLMLPIVGVWSGMCTAFIFAGDELLRRMWRRK